MKTTLVRLMKHLCFPPWRLRRALSLHELEAITQAIRESEQNHTGEIHFAVENALNWRQLLSGTTARDRAIEVFSRLRVWDTEQNNGVLIYLLLADRAVEIVADREVNRRIKKSEWGKVCHTMAAAFQHQAFSEGIIAGVKAVGTHLALHFKGKDREGNELRDQPTIIGD